VLTKIYFLTEKYKTLKRTSNISTTGKIIYNNIREAITKINIEICKCYIYNLGTALGKQWDFKLIQRMTQPINGPFYLK